MPSVLFKIFKLATFILFLLLTVLSSFSYIRRDSNPRPLKREPSALITRPRSLPTIIRVTNVYYTIAFNEGCKKVSKMEQVLVF
jgi:hypothetical protein